MPLATFDAKKVASATDSRKTYLEGIGVDCSKADSLDTAIKLSGLNFEVAKFPISYKKQVLVYDADKKDDIVKDEYYDVKDQFATVRTDTGEALGVVGKNYSILQNADSFSFLDSIVGGGSAKFDTAGIYGSTGAKSFIAIKTEGLDILGDQFQPYILALNSFDGSGCVRVMFTPIRCICSNTIARAIHGAQNKVSIRHCSTLDKKLEAAKMVLLENTKYLAALKKEAEELAVKPFSRDAYLEMIKMLNPVNMESKHLEVEMERNAQIISQLTKAYDQEDLNNFANSSWRAIQALADYESHKPIFRNTKLAAYNNMNTVIDGMPMLNQAYEYVKSYV